LLKVSPITAAVFAILNSKRIGVTTWPFGVTWRHRSRDQSIPHGPFLRPIGGPSNGISISNRFRDDMIESIDSKHIGGHEFDLYM